MSEKTRINALAKTLNVPSKVILEKCRAEGIELKNHMATVTKGLEMTIREWFSEGEHTSALETAAPVDLKKVRIKPKRKTAAAPAEQPAEEDERLAAEPGLRERAFAESGEGGAATAVAEAPPGLAPESEFAEAITESAEAPVETEPPAAPAETVTAPAPLAAEAPVQPEIEVPPTETPAKAAEAPAPVEPPPPIKPEPVRPAGPQNVPAPAKLAGPRVVRYEPINPQEAAPYRSGGPRRRLAPDAPGTLPAPPGIGGPARRRTGTRAVAESPTRVRPRREGQRGGDAGERLREWRDRDMAELKERLQGATGRRIHSRRIEAKSKGGIAAPQGPITRAEISEPIAIKDFCSAVGLPFVRLVSILKREHNLVPNINATLPKAVAELVAAELGIELAVKEAKTSLNRLVEDYAARPREQAEPRPPVITVLGHVDHGKTSLLDAVRRTRVTAQEDGGITQHLGSYHLVREGRPVTFLDTPGHEAFTAMRARGAQLTDIVVLVVAADDGVMTQTIEAIHHAQAAKVPIVVALNKCDLGNVNENMIFGQLSEHGLTPTQWGGETDVFRTSALTGEGIDKLLQHLADLAELLELRADPTFPASGTVIEAETKEGVGPVITALVQEGTLRVGDVIVCGGSFGKVRALLSDAGARVDSAGPSIPVEVWGLNDVPEAGDRFYMVDNLQRADEIANETKQRRVLEGRLGSTKARNLEDLFKQKVAGTVPELNVILKADVSGSLSALRNVLGEIPADEVVLTIRHGAVGAITDSDVLLADACDGIIIGFRVVPAPGAKHLAEERGVDIRCYKVIYEVVDDIRKAMEGLLAPEERVEQRATIDVREVFRISKLGVVAGCYVTDGLVNRNHLARLIRDGVVIRDGCKLSSLRRFKDDAREVRAGLECGIRLEGFDDVKAGDIIHMYEIVKVPRKLKS